MNDGPELDLVELKRQLIDLADSAGPWDDPMPRVRQQAVMTPPATRLPRRRWPAALDPVKLATVAAVAVVAVGAGWLIRDGDGGSGGASSEKAASGGGPGSASSAAAAADSAQPPKASRRTSGTAGSCAVPTTTSQQLALTTPARATLDSVIRVRVRLRADASLSHTGILVFSHGLVVGRLAPISTVTLPGARPTLTGGASAIVQQLVGRLVYAPVPECDPPGTSKAPHPSALRDGPLPAGTYQLAATAQGRGPVQRSAPITVVIG